MPHTKTRTTNMKLILHNEEPPLATTPIRPTVLITGGCGFIGSHTLVCLLEQDYNVVVVDSLVNSVQTSLDRVTEIVGLSDSERKQRLVFRKVDICDEAKLRQVFEESPKFVSCIHFAGLKVSAAVPVSGCQGVNDEVHHLTTTFTGCRRKYNGAVAVLRQQCGWYIDSAEAARRVRLPFDRFQQLCHRIR